MTLGRGVVPLFGFFSLLRLLPPAGLLAIVWCSVGLAGVFVLARRYVCITITRVDRIRYAYLMHNVRFSVRNGASGS